ncbi:MAG: hypothetical protein Q4A01_06380 [Coriobacteriales bacterium]|nr:hypothetical protein [Coriobacteriales bacterium]
MSKLVCVAIALCLLLPGLWGCMPNDAPVTTEALLARCAAAGDMDNARAKADVKLNVSVGTYRVTIPVVLDAAVAGNTMHGTAVADLSDLDVADYAVEYYLEQLDGSIMCYLGAVRDGKVGNWRSFAIDTTGTIDLRVLIDLLRSSELTRVSTNADDKVCYELTVPTNDVLDAADKLTRDDLELGSMGKDALMAELEGDKVEVDFSEDCRIRSLDASTMFTYRDIAAKTPAITIDVEAYALVEGYGAVNPTEVTIPASVRAKAAPTTEPISLEEVLGANNPIVEALPEQ